MQRLVNLAMLTTIGPSTVLAAAAVATSSSQQEVAGHPRSSREQQQRKVNLPWTNLSQLRAATEEEEEDLYGTPGQKKDSQVLQESCKSLC